MKIKLTRSVITTSSGITTSKAVYNEISGISKTIIATRLTIISFIPTINRNIKGNCCSGIEIIVNTYCSVYRARAV